MQQHVISKGMHSCLRKIIKAKGSGPDTALVAAGRQPQKQTGLARPGYREPGFPPSEVTGIIGKGPRGLGFIQIQEGIILVGQVAGHITACFLSGGIYQANSAVAPGLDQGGVFAPFPQQHQFVGCLPRVQHSFPGAWLGLRHRHLGKGAAPKARRQHAALLSAKTNQVNPLAFIFFPYQLPQVIHSALHHVAEAGVPYKGVMGPDNDFSVRPVLV
jgi:hypothetical protein